MNPEIRIAVVGDFEANRLSHEATNKALCHGAEALELAVHVDWLATPTLEIGEEHTKLEEYDGFFCSPGGPYKSMNSALEAIRFAREQGWPFLGT